MATALLTSNDQKEGWSLLYVKALATRAGYSTTRPMIDRDSVDLSLRAGGPFRPGLDLQLKATSKLSTLKDGLLSFELPIKNYNDLREETQTPRLLVVLELPSNMSKCITITEEELILRRRAYWLNLQTGNDPVMNKTSVTVHIPQHNLLNVEALCKLMDKSARGGI